MTQNINSRNHKAIHIDERGEYFAHYKNLTIRSVFQPIFNTNEKMIGVEALVRLKSDKHHNVNPELFFQSEHITQIDKLNVERISRALHINNYSISRHSDLKLFLNILPCSIQMISGPISGDTNLVDHLKMQQINQTNVVLEIMELEYHNNALLMNTTKNLSRHGFTIAIDDFGVKGSTPSRVNFINPDIIKLDRSLLLSYMNGDRRALELSIEFSKYKGALTVIEGIENQEQLSAMHELNIDMHQGFYLGMPEQMT